MAKLDLFGRHKQRIWEELAEQINADFFKGNMFRTDRVEAFYKNWMVTLDTFMVDKIVYTRIRAPYVNRDDFKFKIYRSNFFREIGKKLGLKDIEVGYEEFDRNFIIQGNDEYKLRMMFQNPHIRELIAYQPAIHLEIKHDAPWLQKKFPKDVNELYFHVGKVLNDLSQLHDLYDLFAITLDHLCHIGTAYEDDPGFEYY